MHIAEERVMEHVRRQKGLCQAHDSCSPVKTVLYPDCIRLDGQMPTVKYFSSSHTLSGKFESSTQSQSVLQHPGPSVKKLASLPGVNGHAQAAWIPNVFPYSNKDLSLAPSVCMNLNGQLQGPRICSHNNASGGRGQSNLKKGSGEEPAAWVWKGSCPKKSLVGSKGGKITWTVGVSSCHCHSHILPLRVWSLSHTFM